MFAAYHAVGVTLSCGRALSTLALPSSGDLYAENAHDMHSNLRASSRVCSYRRDKARENQAATHALGALLAELDAMPRRERLLALVQGVLAGNIFDWGAQACVELYHAGTILEIYQKARDDISHRPWRVDQFDAFEAAFFAAEGDAAPNAPGARALPAAVSVNPVFAVVFISCASSSLVRVHLLCVCATGKPQS